MNSSYGARFLDTLNKIETYITIVLTLFAGTLTVTFFLPAVMVSFLGSPVFSATRTTMLPSGLRKAIASSIDPEVPRETAPGCT